MCNDDSCSKLVPELEFSDKVTIICRDVRISRTALDNVLPNCHPSPHDFTPTTGPNFHKEITNVILLGVNLFIINELLEYVFKQKDLNI